MYIYTYMYIYFYIHIYVYIYTHIYIYTLAQIAETSVASQWYVHIQYIHMFRMHPYVVPLSCLTSISSICFISMHMLYHNICTRTKCSNERGITVISPHPYYPYVSYISTRCTTPFHPYVSYLSICSIRIHKLYHCHIWAYEWCTSVISACISSISSWCIRTLYHCHI